MYPRVTFTRSSPTRAGRGTGSDEPARMLDRPHARTLGRPRLSALRHTRTRPAHGRRDARTASQRLPILQHSRHGRAILGHEARSCPSPRAAGWWHAICPQIATEALTTERERFARERADWLESFVRCAAPLSAHTNHKSCHSIVTFRLLA